ncbi:MAG: class I SAM-dependent methyltransferase [Planctomycetota bacterium]
MNAWIDRLLADPDMQRMGHNQRPEDGNLGLGWLYYALGRIVRPKQAVVIGSWRGFVPLIVARALADNLEGGDLLFIDPSLVDRQWRDPERVQAFFARHDLDNVRHVPMTTQEFAASDEMAALPEIQYLFVDGYHTAEQARFDYEAFAPKLVTHGFALFHDSMIRRRSRIYGEENAYEMNVPDYIDELRGDASVEVLDVPFGTGVTLLRKRGPGSDRPRLEGIEGRCQVRADGSERVTS